MSRKILINIENDESRAIVLNNGRIANIEMEISTHAKQKGNIYKGTVTSIEKGLEAAFVNYGTEKEGFLSVSEIRSKFFAGGDRERREIGGFVKTGDSIMVQILKDGVGGKGVTFTMNIAVPGTYFVLLPQTEGGMGLSRRLSDDERSSVRDVVSEVVNKINRKNYGIIVRTNALDQKKSVLQNDLQNLINIWKNIEKKYSQAKGISLLYHEQGLAVRFIRDYLSSDVDEVIVDDRKNYDYLKDYFEDVMPKYRKHLKLYDEKMPLFSKYGVEKQIEELFSRSVHLPSGGSIVFGETEALVAVDVNSGRRMENGVEETAFSVNSEAAVEIARQVILRDLGGLIVIDLVDMKSSSHRREIERIIRDAFKKDKAKIKFGRINEFGLFPMSRQRLKANVMRGYYSVCDACSGIGVTRTYEHVASSIFRKINERFAHGISKYLCITVSSGLYDFLLKEKNREINEIQSRTGIEVEIVKNDNFLFDRIEMDFRGLKNAKKAKRDISRSLSHAHKHVSAPPVEAFRNGDISAARKKDQHVITKFFKRLFGIMEED
jgi:ribonuclease E